MALNKQKVLDTGVTVEYWRASVNRDIFTRKARVVLLGYVSQEARNNGADPVPGAQYALGVSGDEFDSYFGSTALNPEGMNPEVAAYQLTKAAMISEIDENGEEVQVQGFFSDAVDV